MKFSEQVQNSGGTISENKSSSSDDSSTYNQSKWGASKSGNGIKLFEKSSCVDVERRIVIGTLPILQASTMLTQKPTTIYFPSTHSYTKILNKSDEAPTLMASACFASGTLPTPSITTSTGTNSSSSTMCCTSSTLSNLLVWTHWKHSLQIQTLQILPMSSTLCLI